MPSLLKTVRAALSILIVASAVALSAAPSWAQDTFVPFPTPLVSQYPVGSLIHKGASTGAIQSPGDTYSYTLLIDAEQTATLLITPSKTLLPTVTCVDPSNNVIGTATAVSSGQQVILETVPISTPGTYTFAVSGANATTGDFSIQLILNAAVNRPPVSNFTLATARDLSSSSVRVGCVVGCDRLAVNGTLSGKAQYYSFALQAGEPISLVVKFLSRISASLELLDGSGNVLAVGIPGPQNVSASIRDYVATASGTYYVQVSGSGGSDFNLVATRLADFELTPNGKSDPQPLGSFFGAFGYVGSINGPTGWYSFKVNAGDNLVVNTITPSDQGLEFQNHLFPQINLYDVNLNLVATNRNQPKNTPVEWTALQTGTFLVSVSGAQQTTGEYVLQVQGNTGGQ